MANKLYLIKTSDGKVLCPTEDFGVDPNDINAFVGTAVVDDPSNVYDARARWVWWEKTKTLSPYINPLAELGTIATSNDVMFYNRNVPNSPVAWGKLKLADTISSYQFDNRTFTYRRLGPAPGDQVKAHEGAGIGYDPNAQVTWELEEAEPAAPPPVEILTITAPNTDVTITWAAPHPDQFWIKHYEVEFREQNNVIPVEPVVLPKITIRNLKPLTKYTARVRAVVELDVGQWGSTREVTTKGVAADKHRGTNESIVIFEDPNFLGNSAIQQSNLPNSNTLAAGTWTGGINSVTVVNGVWSLFPNKDYTGQSHVVDTKTGPAADGRYPDPQSWGSQVPAQSVSQVCVTLFGEQGFKGKSVSFFGVAIPDVAKFGLTAGVNSLRVHDGVWEVYSGVGYTGRRYVIRDVFSVQNLGVNIGEYATPADWNGVTFKSIRAYREVLLSLYYDADLKGEAVEVTADNKAQLKDLSTLTNTAKHHFNNIVSSVQVWRGGWAAFLEPNYGGSVYVRLHVKGGPNKDGIYPTVPTWADEQISSFRQINLLLASGDIYADPSVDVWGNQFPTLNRTTLKNNTYSVFVFEGIWELLNTQSGLIKVVSSTGGPKGDGHYLTPADWEGAHGTVAGVRQPTAPNTPIAGVIDEAKRPNPKDDPTTYRVVAPNFAGESIANVYVAKKITNLAINKTGAKTYTLSWGAPDDMGSKIDKYTLYWRERDTGDWKTIDVAAKGEAAGTKISTSLDLTTDAVKRQFEFYVRAHNVAGWNDPSDILLQETHGVPVWDRNKKTGDITVLDDNKIISTSKNCGETNMIICADAITSGKFTWIVEITNTTTNPPRWTGFSRVFIANEQYVVGTPLRQQGVRNVQAWALQVQEKTRVTVDVPAKEVKFTNFAGTVTFETFPFITGTNFKIGVALCGHNEGAIITPA